MAYFRLTFADGHEEFVRSPGESRVSIATDGYPVGYAFGPFGLLTVEFMEELPKDHEEVVSASGNMVGVEKKTKRKAKK